MGFTSAAEAKLDARIRPDITEMRSRTPYPKRRLSVVPTAGPGTPGGPGAAEPASTGGGDDGQLDAVATAAGVITGASPPGSAGTGGVTALRAGTPGTPVHRQQARTPIRLTRRGRLVVGGLLIVTVIAAAALLWLALANRAQASSGAGRPGSSHALARVVVQPGQTLWSIASKADPYVDPRAVIQEIIDENQLAGTSIHPGQVLLVPRG
jgi:nucleoid-associated protein YgaU